MPISTTIKSAPSATLLPDDATLNQLVLQTLDERKAADIVTIDLKGKTDIADAMIIASGTSGRHVSSLAEHVAHALKEAGMQHVPIEGREAAEWVLVDAGNLIVHLFGPEIREHYKLEKMWAMPSPSGAV